MIFKYIPIYYHHRENNFIILKTLLKIIKIKNKIMNGQPNTKVESQSKPNYREMFKGKIDSEGFLQIGHFSTQLLGRQSKSVAAFLDGDEGTNLEINFGEKYSIKYKGNSGNYDTMSIHIDDLEKFINAVRDYYGENK